MTNLPPVSDGTRKPTLPEDLWQKVRPVLRAAIGVGNPLTVTEIADALKIKPPSVSAWINDKGRPNSYNLMSVMRIVRDRCVEPGLQRAAKEILGELGDTLAAADLAAQQLTDSDGVPPDEAWLLMRSLVGRDQHSLYFEAKRVRSTLTVSEHHKGRLGQMDRPPPTVD